MLTRLSLRARIFLFFCLLAAGGAALAGGSLYFGWTRSDGGLPAAPFVQAFLIFAFLNTGLALIVWLLFDEHLAKPITKLAADLRLRAHSGIDAPVDSALSWTGGDMDPGDTVTYDLYFGTADPPPLYQSDLSSTTYDPSPLTHSQQYFWQIVSRDGTGCGIRAASARAVPPPAIRSGHG
mgnify:CR=1 FL=1